MPQPAQTVAYILSAGQGQRLGGLCKGLVLINGLPLVTRQIDLMREGGLKRVVVVVGHQAERLKAAVAQHADQGVGPSLDGTVECIDSLSAGADQFSVPDIQQSVTAALRHAQRLFHTHAQLSGLVISLVDLPLLNRDELDQVLAKGRDVCSMARQPVSLQGQPGHPVWLSRSLVLAAKPEAPGFSLRQLLNQLSAEKEGMVERIETGSLGHFTDIDTPACVEHLRAHYGLEISVRVSS